MADGTVRGEFVWHELLTPNRAGAQEFYRKTVSWNAQPWDDDPSYVMFATKNGPIGGVMEAPAATPYWLPCIATPNVDETTDAATRLGARVQTPPTPLPGGGRYATLFDPQGALFGIHASGGDDNGAPPGAPRPGEFSWHELATSVAPDIAFAFYAALFAWDEITQYDMGPMGMYLIFGRGGRQLGGIFDKGAAGKPGSAYWLGYVSVTDLEGTVERAKAARGSVLAEPMDVPGGDRIAQLMDPYGALFALHKAAGQTASAAGGKTTARKPAKAAKPAARKKQPARKTAAKKKPAKKKPAKPAARKKAKTRPAAKKKAAKKPAKTKTKAKAKKKAKKRRR